MVLIKAEGASTMGRANKAPRKAFQGRHEGPLK